MSKLGRQRGVAFEREVCNALKVVFPNAKRHLEFQSEEAELGTDIDNTERYKIQCKRGRKYSSISKIEEVNCAANDIPMLITRGDQKRSVACLYLDDFVMMLKELAAGGDTKHRNAIHDIENIIENLRGEL